MEIYSYEYQLKSMKEERDEKLFKVLKNGIHHITSIEGYRGIIRDGYIIPNDRSFPFTFPQTESSYALYKGYISLFDFQTPSIRNVILEYDKWIVFFVCDLIEKPAKVIIRLKSDIIRPKLILNEVARNEFGCKKVWIPNVEAWYPERIPVSAIDRFIFYQPHFFRLIDSRFFQFNPSPRGVAKLNNFIDAFTNFSAALIDALLVRSNS